MSKSRDTLTPNGDDVRSCVRRISVATASGDRHVIDSMPRPPAFDTAATRSAVVADPIGAWMTGSRMPSCSHSGVLNGTPITSERPTYVDEGTAPASADPS
jgi:hypothetical protein